MDLIKGCITKRNPSILLFSSEAEVSIESQIFAYVYAFTLLKFIYFLGVLSVWLMNDIKRKLSSLMSCVYSLSCSIASFYGGCYLTGFIINKKIDQRSKIISNKILTKNILFLFLFFKSITSYSLIGNFFSYYFIQ